MAFVVVGFMVVDVDIDKKTGGEKRDKQISQRFQTRAAAEDFCELAKKCGHPRARVREVMKHDDI